MTIRSALETEIRHRLSDDDGSVIYWSDDQIDTWINAALNELSAHFPRTLTTTITTSADDRTYDLPANFLKMLSVEYPTGDEPPTYLSHKAFNGPNFWGNDGYYDVIQRGDDTDVNELWISEKPAASETITINYHGKHTIPTADGDTITLPDHLKELLILFCLWKAFEERAANEAANPDPSNLIISTMTLNAYRAERAFKWELERLQRAHSETAITSWSMDKFDQIY